MAKEVGEGWGRLENFVLWDDDARWKAIAWAVLIAGTFGSVDLAVVRSPLGDAVLLMGIVALIVFGGGTGWYCFFSARDECAHPASRRALLVEVAAVLVGLFASLRVPIAEAGVVERKLQRISANPTSPQSIQQASELLARARAARVKIPHAVVKDTGSRFLEAARGQGGAWDAVLQFLDYRSSLNPPPIRGRGTIYLPAARYLHLEANFRASPSTEIYASGVANASNHAQLRRLASPDVNLAVTSAPAALIFRNAAVLLDGLFLKNVFIENSHITYGGGALVLENVSFIGCTFDVVQDANGRSFAAAVLAQSPMAFRVG